MQTIINTMSFNESAFKNLGFRPKPKAKGVLEASAEIVQNEYITIQLSVQNGEVAFDSIEIQGKKADDVRRKYLTNYSLEEIHQLFTDY